MDRVTQMIAGAADYLWLNALIAVPVALFAAALSRSRACRPATRHGLWLVVLGSFILPAAAFRFVPSMNPDFRAASRAVVDGVASAEKVGREVFSRPRWPTIRGGAGLSGAPTTAAAVPADTVPALTGQANSPSLALWALAAVERACSWPLAEMATLRGFLGATRERLSSQPAQPIAAGDATGPTRSAAVPHANGPNSPERVVPASPRPRPRVMADSNAPPSRHAPSATAPAAGESVPDRSPTPHLSRSISPPRMHAAEPALAGGPTAIPGSAPAPPSPSRMAAQVADWIAHAGTLRRALADLPPLPAPIWLGGLGAVLAWRLAQYLAARHALRGATPAPEAVSRLADEAARLVGLRRAPRVFMVERRVSPMVWCAGRTRIILPAGLWRTLDGRSRRAVMVHELAHLKRRDHWVWRLSLVIGAVYWWHPVAWWAARRVREEADFSCDAWVTSLLPTSRRAYAEALLTAQSYVLGPRLLPLPALCMASTRTRRLSRRLIMVMTGVKSPRSSFAGLLLAGTIAAGAFLVSPSLACPPDDEKTKKGKAKLTSTTTKPALSVVTTARGPKPPAPAAAPRPPAAAIAAERAAQAHHQELTRALTAHAAAAHAHQPESPGSADLKRLLERLERIEQRLDALNERTSAAPGVAGSPGLARGVATMAPRVIEVQPTPRVDVQPRMIADIPIIAGLRSAQAPTPQPDAGGPTETRTYNLPKGKRQALWDLMARQDVPIFVSEDGEGIAVQGTPAQHRVFRAFVDMIHPEGASRSDAGSDDVLREMLRVEEAGGAHRALAQVRAAQAGQQRQQVEQMRQMERAVRQQAEAVRRQAQQVEKQAERLREQADKIREKADDLREKAEEEKSQARREGLTAGADAMEAEADALEARADAAEADAEALEEQADAMEEQAEAAAEQADELEEAAARAQQGSGSVNETVRVDTALPPAAPSGVFAPSAPARP